MRGRMGEKHSRTRWRRGPILLAVGRLQRGNKGVHCRVYRALYVIQRHAAEPRVLSTRVFRIRFSCRGGFADRDEIDRTGPMDKLGNICDREPSSPPPRCVPAAVSSTGWQRASPSYATHAAAERNDAYTRTHAHNECNVRYRVSRIITSVERMIRNCAAPRSHRPDNHLR